MQRPMPFKTGPSAVVAPGLISCPHHPPPARRGDADAAPAYVDTAPEDGGCSCYLVRGSPEEENAVVAAGSDCNAVEVMRSREWVWLVVKSATKSTQRENDLQCCGGCCA